MTTARSEPVGTGWLARVRQRAFRGFPSDREPVVLRHSRIYILPTKRGWAMIATIAIMLVSSLNYALTLGIAVSFLLAGLMAAALLHTFRNLAGIEVTPLSAGEAFAGAACRSCCRCTAAPLRVRRSTWRRRARAPQATFLPARR
jgi:hypothetical protein